MRSLDVLVSHWRGKRGLRWALGALPLALAVAAGSAAAASPNPPAPPAKVAAHRVAPIGRPVPIGYGAPLRLDRLHPPRPVRAVAPIVAPVRTLRFGDLIVPVAVLSQRQLNQVNGMVAGNEAQIATFVRSVGVTPSRADSVASATVAGAVLGAVIGCVGGALLLTATVVLIPLIPLDCAKDIVLGGVPGALIGAAVGATR